MDARLHFKAKTLKPIMKEVVKEGSTIYTDDHRSFKKLKGDYNHQFVYHSRLQYVLGNIHTNTIEGFWGLFKRGIIGIYHYVSPKHLQKYCEEFTYRYNTRNLGEQYRFDSAIEQSVNRRLTYNSLISKV